MIRYVERRFPRQPRGVDIASFRQIGGDFPALWGQLIPVIQSFRDPVVCIEGCGFVEISLIYVQLERIAFAPPGPLCQTERILF